MTNRNTVREVSLPFVSHRTWWRSWTLGFLIAPLALLNALAGGLPVQTSKPAGSERPRAERLAAVAAAGLGFQLQEWLSDFQRAAAANSSNPVDSTLSSMTIETIDTTSRIVGVSLVPRPADVTKTLPKDPVQRLKSASTILNQWRTQISQRVNEYLVAHYLVGEGVGSLRNLLALSEGSPLDAQPLLEKGLAATRAALALPQLDVSATLETKWLDIAQDIMAPRRTAQQSSSLRTRLELWFDAFSAEARARAQ